MPQIGNITVKKADGTTDAVYTALVASSGDGSPAMYEYTAASSVRAHRPAFSIMSRKTASGTARRVTTSYVYPVVQTVSGVPTVVAKIPIEVSMAIPTNVPDADISEAVLQGCRLLSSSSTTDIFRSGFAPT